MVGKTNSSGPLGIFFTPNVDTDGNLNWSNNGELENPPVRNIMGPKGDPGRDGTDLGAYVTPTASGAPASFDDGAEDLPVKSLTVDIEPAQSGSGEASPDNIRPISGWTAATVTRTGGTSAPLSYTIDFPAEAGTVYGGTLDVTNGVLTVSKVKHTISASEVTAGWANANYSRIAYAQISKPTDGTQSALGPNKEGYFLMAEYTMSHAPTFDTSDFIGKVIYNADGARYWFGFPYGTSLADMRTALGGKFYIYELVNPITYQLTPTEVDTLLGANSIHADTGAVRVTYRADPTLIYNKLTAAIISSGGIV